ncbi:MAG: hypothetical protein DA405_11375 [Bacteroidetes bacterium]|nr:MAG: hypothetical protein DA405_11375 [Bacteroidota bacterium]
MQKAPRFILILGLLGMAASVFNYFNGQIDWYINLFSIVGSLGLVVAYFHTNKSLTKKED